MLMIVLFQQGQIYISLRNGTLNTRKIERMNLKNRYIMSTKDVKDTIDIINEHIDLANIARFAD